MRIFSSIDCLSIFISFKQLANLSASPASVDKRRSNAMSALPILPAAFILGANMNAIFPASTDLSPMPETAFKAIRPGLVLPFSTSRPFFTIILFSSVNGTTSATVPSADNSK